MKNHNYSKNHLKLDICVITVFRSGKIITFADCCYSNSTDVIPEFRLGENDNKEDIKKKIAGVKYQGGRTNTGDALHYVRTRTFPVGGGRRPNVPHITIVLTDGMSQNSSYTEQEAAAVHGQGITVFVIGIGNQVKGFQSWD